MMENVLMRIVDMVRPDVLVLGLFATLMVASVIPGMLTRFDEAGESIGLPLSITEITNTGCECQQSSYITCFCAGVKQSQKWLPMNAALNLLFWYAVAVLSVGGFRGWQHE